jgi:hypothetical protein
MPATEAEADRMEPGVESIARGKPMGNGVELLTRLMVGTALAQ